MRRRSVLRSLLALIVGPSAGCLSLSPTGTTTESATTRPLPSSGDGALPEFDAGEPFETRRVGTGSETTAHRAVIWNDDADRRTIGVRLYRADTGDAVVDVSPTFPAYGSFRIDVFRPADYVLDVVPPTDTDRRLGVPEDLVDCNESATHVAIRPDGRVRARVVSTAVACGDDIPTTASRQNESTTSTTE
ncbi:hypothetical protein [Halobellus captivus]|uniref:hypothetical protein n=1 Tax=Halobellus captivus TaxID=2592614 RepID=UPI0011A37E05|nr:hypothetical protein [Halobellus captivus]